MSTSEIDYSARMIGPEVLEQGRAQTIKLEVSTLGALVAPTALGSSVSLLKPGGAYVFEAQPISVVGSVAQYAIPAGSLPDTLDLGVLYQLRWTLVLPDGTTRTFRRSCSLARFQMVLPVADEDIIDGEYPDLLDQLAEYSDSLDKWLYAAKRDVLRELAKKNQWPEIIVDPGDLYELIRQRCMWRIFKFLATRSPQGGDTNYAEAKREHHELYQAEWSTLSARFDRDQDGLADSEARESVQRVIHPGGAPRRRRTRDPRW